MLSDDIFIFIAIFYTVSLMIFSLVLIFGTLEGYLFLAAQFLATKL